MEEIKEGPEGIEKEIEEEAPKRVTKRVTRLQTRRDQEADVTEITIGKGNQKEMRKSRATKRHEYPRYNIRGIGMALLMLLIIGILARTSMAFNNGKNERPRGEYPCFYFHSSCICN